MAAGGRESERDYRTTVERGRQMKISVVMPSMPKLKPNMCAQVGVVKETSVNYKKKVFACSPRDGKYNREMLLYTSKTSTLLMYLINKNKGHMLLKIEGS